MMNLRKIMEKIGCVPANIHIFQLPSALEYQTWYQIKAEIHPFYPMIRYLNDLILKQVLCYDLYIGSHL